MKKRPAALITIEGNLVGVYDGYADPHNFPGLAGSLSDIEANARRVVVGIDNARAGLTADEAVELAKRLVELANDLQGEERFVIADQTTDFVRRNEIIWKRMEDLPDHACDFLVSYLGAHFWVDPAIVDESVYPDGRHPVKFADCRWRWLKHPVEFQNPKSIDETFGVETKFEPDGKLRSVSVVPPTDATSAAVVSDPPYLETLQSRPAVIALPYEPYRKSEQKPVTNYDEAVAWFGKSNDPVYAMQYRGQEPAAGKLVHSLAEACEFYSVMTDDDEVPF